MNLTKEQEADIEINEVRSDAQVDTLDSVLQVARGINGLDDLKELVRLLNLPIQTEGNMVTREEWLRTLKNGAGDAWQATKNCLQEGRNGEPTLTISGIETLLEELIPPRSTFLNDYSRLRGKRILTPAGITQNLGIAQPLIALPDTHVPPFIPEQEKEVYKAITIAGYTEAGREAIRSTLSAARRKVGVIAQENLFRATTYNEIILQSIIGLFEAASSTRSDAIALLQELERIGVSGENAQQILDDFNFDLNAREIAELGGSALQNIEFTLRMAREEERVDQVMEKLIPGYRLVKLKQKAKAVLPPDEINKLTAVIDSALHARYAEANLPPPRLPTELNDRVNEIFILPYDGEDEE
jgi:hypothetical protein